MIIRSNYDFRLLYLYNNFQIEIAFCFAIKNIKINDIESLPRSKFLLLLKLLIFRAVDFFAYFEYYSEKLLLVDFALILLCTKNGRKEKKSF